jgi:pyrimidine-nucleoside phosphorylase
VRAQDVIAAKRDGMEIAAGDLRAFVLAVARREVPDYQATAFLMAAYLRGLSRAETVALTGAMIDSGARIDPADFSRPAVDKHSTGGVGDKTSLVVAPLVAACGAAVPMMAGRGLGFTGGTLDKLEAVPGTRVRFSPDEFRDQVRRIGLAIAGQSSEMVPADGTLYALRDVTATVDSIPLITASIVAKKVAEGARFLVLDVKIGRGALMDGIDRGRALARSIVEVGSAFGLTVRALLTDMDAPLGRWVGNAAEVAECFEILDGGGDARLRELCLVLAGEMLALAGLATSPEAGMRAAEREIASGRGRSLLEAMFVAQGGRPAEFLPWTPTAAHRAPIAAAAAGVVVAIDARAVGEAAVFLGAGRETAGDAIDPEASVEIVRPVGTSVQTGEPVLVAYASDPARLAAASARLAGAVRVGDGPAAPPPLVGEGIA